ncbi:uncharacterized protein LOC112562953 [Pomacea canaliculata]|uniref:uncharacterized protein LOC112562953 n=1 Tax=Pomacea canaliculata TaxID=400727 RepID=UPI000D7257D4|nr:uncharacterized protein LOC112562953 [Pomacea canaliculata]
MFALVILTGLLSTVFSQLHNECHTNAQLLREEEVVALVADLLDRNQDNIITVGEVVVGFGEILNYQFQTSEALILQMNLQQLVALAAQYDLSIDKEHFVQKWHERFGDGLGFVRATFDAYDENKDGKLSILEIENIVKHALATSDNGDGLLRASELRAYLLFIYKNCRRDE